MTQLHSNLSRAASAALIAGLLLPSLAFAETAPRPRLDGMRDKMQQRASSTNTQGVGGQNFCTNIDKAVGKLTEARDTMIEKSGEKREERMDKLADRRGMKDGKLDDKRTEGSETRTANFVKMYEKASTTEAKAAVDTFKAAVEAAVAKRQAAVDAAIATYRTASDKMISDRQAAVDVARAAHKTAVDAAVAQAKADCTAGKDGATVRSTLKAAIKAANEAFRTTTKKPEDLSGQVKSLRTTRDNSIQDAIDTFKTEYEAAKTALKTALGK